MDRAVTARQRPVRTPPLEIGYPELEVEQFIRPPRLRASEASRSDAELRCRPRARVLVVRLSRVGPACRCGKGAGRNSTVWCLQTAIEMEGFGPFGRADCGAAMQRRPKAGQSVALSLPADRSLLAVRGVADLDAKGGQLLAQRIGRHEVPGSPRRGTTPQQLGRPVG